MRGTLRRTFETIPTREQPIETLPQQYFISAAVFAEEQQRIFANHWLYVGHQSQIREPGEYFIVEVGAESIIVIRATNSGDAAIRAFYNVCRHRGARLFEDQAGCVRAIQCQYHAWTYGFDGALSAAPHMHGVPGFDKSNYSLRALNVGVWEGCIFLNLAHSPKALFDWFAPLAGKFSNWSLAELCSARRIEYQVCANWKLIFENYSECYHCPGVHPTLSKLTPYDSAVNDLSEGPFLGGFMAITRGKSLTMSGNICAAPVGNLEGADDKRVFYYSIFPNMLLSMHPDYVMVHQVWPKAPDRTLIVCDWFFHRDAVAAPGAPYNPADAVEFWDMTNRQDWHVCELSQKGIASRAYEPGPYSPRETIPAAWDRHYMRHMKEG